jgi:hypothetical protein
MVGGVKVVERRDTFKSTTSSSAVNAVTIQKKISSLFVIAVTKLSTTIDDTTAASAIIMETRSRGHLENVE